MTLLVINVTYNVEQIIGKLIVGIYLKENRHITDKACLLLASYINRKGKERKGIYVLMEKKIPFVGLEPTPSAVRADVQIQLD